MTGRPEPRAVFADTNPECRHWIGTTRRYCHTTDRLRPYPIGWRCPAHTPAAVAGRPEPQPGPGWPTAATSPDNASDTHDTAAITAPSQGEPT